MRSVRFRRELDFERGVARRRRGDEDRAERDRAALLARCSGREPDGLVTRHFGTHVETLLAGGSVASCLLSPKVHKLLPVAVGDRVWTEPGAGPRERVVVARASRRNELRRRRGEEDRKGHVIAANIDRMAICASTREPPLRPGALDRYLLLAAALSIEPLIVVTKAELAEAADPVWALLEPYRQREVPLILSSARTGVGLDELRSALASRVTVFAGHSGVGKSSLCKALGLPGAPEEGELSRKGRRVRGRHTTSVARLLPLPGAGGWVVDTPGVRAISGLDVAREDVREQFGDLGEIAGPCPFDDCLHRDEDGCAVRAAEERSELPPGRYAGYLRLLASLAEEDASRRAP
jgi:ribosome biogenesis GTPase